MVTILAGAAVGAAVFAIAEIAWPAWRARRARRRQPATGEQCEVCGIDLTPANQVEVREEQTGDTAAEEIAGLGGGSFLAAYFCRDHAPANMET